MCLRKEGRGVSSPSLKVGRGAKKLLSLTADGVKLLGVPQTCCVTEALSQKASKVIGQGLKVACFPSPVVIKATDTFLLYGPV